MWRLVDALEASPGAEDHLPPLASLVAAYLGPLGCVQLGRCARSWCDLVPGQHCSSKLHSWIAEHWPSCTTTAGSWADEIPAATPVPHIVGGAESFLYSGTMLLLSAALPQRAPWPTSPRGSAALVDSAFIAAARTPRALSQCDARGLSPLHAAARRRSPQLVRLLLELRAPVDLVCDQDGRTPLHCAAAAGDARCVRLLLEFRASPSARDHMRKLPLELAARMRAEDVQTELLTSMEKQQQGSSTTTCTTAECVLS